MVEGDDVVEELPEEAAKGCGCLPCSGGAEVGEVGESTLRVSALLSRSALAQESMAMSK